MVKSIDQEGNATTYEHDANGNVTAVISPLGARTEIGYDALDRRREIREADGAVTRLEYDAMGNLIRVALPQENYEDWNAWKQYLEREANKAFNEVTRPVREFQDKVNTTLDNAGRAVVDFGKEKVAGVELKTTISNDANIGGIYSERSTTRPSPFSDWRGDILVRTDEMVNG